MGAEPKNPPKKRVINKAATLSLVADPMLKRPRINTGGSIDHLRPYASLIGAQNIGPKANPKIN